MQWEGRYHALAKDEQCFLRCERLELPMSQMGQTATIISGALSPFLPDADIYDIYAG
jgi:hypothetical protein